MSLFSATKISSIPNFAKTLFPPAPSCQGHEHTQAWPLPRPSATAPLVGSFAPFERRKVLSARSKAGPLPQSFSADGLQEIKPL